MKEDRSLKWEGMVMTPQFFFLSFFSILGNAIWWWGGAVGSYLQKKKEKNTWLLNFISFGTFFHFPCYAAYSPSSKIEVGSLLFCRKVKSLFFPLSFFLLEQQQSFDIWGRKKPCRIAGSANISFSFWRPRGVAKGGFLLKRRNPFSSFFFVWTPSNPMHQTPSIPHPKKVFSKVARLFASLRIAIFQEECASLPRLLFAYKTGFCSVQVHKIILHPFY